MSFKFRKDNILSIKKCTKCKKGMHPEIEKFLLNDEYRHVLIWVCDDCEWKKIAKRIAQIKDNCTEKVIQKSDIEVNK